MEDENYHSGVLPSLVDAIFYPAEEDQLRRELSRLLNDTPRPPDTPPVQEAAVLITPCAALKYAGPGLAMAFNRARGRTVGRVIILNPLHRDREPFLILPESSAHATPLGKTKHDQALKQTLLALSPKVIQKDTPFFEEHGIELPLLFTQLLFPQAQILPLILGENSVSLVKLLTTLLNTLLADGRDEILIVASTNFSAYTTEREAEKSRDLLLENIQSGNWRALLQEYRNHSITSPGAGIIASLLALDTMRLKPEILEMTSSFALASKQKQGVFYGSIAFNGGV